MRAAGCRSPPSASWCCSRSPGRSDAVRTDEVLPYLRGLGFREEHAATLADHFLTAERHGKHGHGLTRVEWLATLRGLDVTAEPLLVESRPGYELWDGNGALGYLTLT